VSEVRVNDLGLSDDEKWLTDRWANDILWTIRVRRVLREVQSDYQRVQVLDTPRLGRMLVLDGNIQCAEADEAGYHEMIVHPALCRRGARDQIAGRRALIIGGGDGGAAREILRHPDVSRVDLVDIDAEVIRAARELLPRIWQRPHGDGPLDDDPRFHVHCVDGIGFLEAVKEPYDLVVVDASDPVGPGAQLYAERFYRLIRGVLRDGGAVAVQGGSFWYLPEVFKLVYHRLSSVFPMVKPLSCFTAVYPGGVWNLHLATLGDDPACVDEARAARLSGCQFYSAETHASAFVLPPVAMELLEQEPLALDEVSARVERLTAKD